MRALSVESRPTSRPVRADGLHRWYLSTARGQASAPTLLFKQLLPAFAQDEGIRERWLQLVERNTELAHPSCSNVLDFGSAEGGVYLVSRYDAGLPLSTLMHTMREVGEPMAHELVAHIGSELLGALAHVQASDPSLTHLDLDPAGLLVQPSGSLLLPEFGLWSLLSPAELSRCRFDAARVDYSSPELVRSRPSDPRSDIFSVGILLYELLAGERPFLGKTQLVIAMALAEGTHRPLRELAPLAPESLCDIVEMMLASEASDRFQSASAAQQALVATSMVRPDSASIRQRALAALHAAVPNAAWTAAAGPDESAGAEVERARVPVAYPHGAVSIGVAVVTTAGTKEAQSPAAARATSASLPEASGEASPVGEPMPPPLFASGLPMMATPDALPPGVPVPVAVLQEGASTRDFAASSDLVVNDGRTEHLRPAPQSAQLRAAPAASRPRSVPELWQHRAAVEPAHPPPALVQRRAPVEPSRPYAVPELVQHRVAAEPARPWPSPEASHAPGTNEVSDGRAETVDVPKPAKFTPRPLPALSVVSGSEGVAFRLPRPAFRDGAAALPASERAVSLAPNKSRSLSPPRGTDDSNSAWSPPKPAGKWQDPSATLFQLKRPSKAPRPGRKAQAPVLAVAVLSALFGFSAVAGLYLVFRLCQ